MDHISNVIKNNKSANNVTIVTVNNSNNDNNDNNVDSYKDGKYALDKTKFTPNTEETQLAETIAESLDDLQNYAFYWHVIKRLGISKTYSLWKGLLEEIEEKRGSRYEIRSPKKYFAWKFRQKRF